MVFNLRDQFVPIVSQGIERFADNVRSKITGDIPFSEMGRVSARPSQKHSTENLEFPLNVSSADRGLGNHGHYIMFYINTQERAKLRTSGEAGGGSVVDDVSQGYDIPKYVRQWNTVSQSYETKDNEAAQGKQLNDNIRKNQETDPMAIRQGFQQKKGAGQYQSKGSTIKVKRAPTKRLKTAIALFMPATVQTSYSSNYTDTEIGALTEQALNAYNAATTGAGARAAFKEVLNMDESVAEELQKTLLGAIGIIPGFTGAREAFEMKEGSIIADRLELAFKGINKRAFQYTFKMIPKNQLESEMVRKIVFAFKANMLPEFVGGNRAGRRLIVPNTFDIQYMYAGKSNEFLHHISTCVLENMSVSYGGDRYKTFEGQDDGAPPVETSITLNFKEMELITRERVFEGF